MNFGDALMMLKAKGRIARTGWNGKDMYLYLVGNSEFTVNRAPLNEILPEGTAVSYRSHIDMRAADGTFVPWVASQTDLLADDWVLVE